jgi:hypothetical protein
MAKVVQSQQQVTVEPWWVRGRIVYIGFGLGMLWWVLTSLLKHYAIDPIACRDLATATTCVNSFGVAGSIAAIIVGIIGVIALVRLVQPRPIVIALPTAILLWDLSVFMAGLSWWETLLWALFFYTVSYTLFWLAARLNNTVASLALAAVVVIVIRLLLLI